MAARLDAGDRGPGLSGPAGDAPFVRRIDEVDQVVAHLELLGRARLGRPDVHAPIHLHRIDGHQFDVARADEPAASPPLTCPRRCSRPGPGAGPLRQTATTGIRVRWVGTGGEGEQLAGQEMRGGPGDANVGPGAGGQQARGGGHVDQLALGGPAAHHRRGRAWTALRRESPRRDRPAGDGGPGRCARPPPAAARNRSAATSGGIISSVRAAASVPGRGE